MFQFSSPLVGILHIIYAYTIRIKNFYTDRTLLIRSFKKVFLRFQSLLTGGITVQFSDTAE
jgi:hypothetical protein